MRTILRQLVDGTYFFTLKTRPGYPLLHDLMRRCTTDTLWSLFIKGYSSNVQLK